MTVRILHGDCREAMKTLAECSVDSIVTDPPYHLTNNGGGPAKGLNNAYTRSRAGAASGGFMGMAWDGGDVAFDPATWAEALRVLKPGGYLLAFSGTRTYHRMVCAIEDAGFEIRDQIGWAFGSGFPKSHNGPWGGTALKPAWEPIVVARKPLAGTVEANWREHGTGSLNIDACRIDGRERTDYGLATATRSAGNTYGEPSASADFDASKGRWPANLIHDGSDEVLQAFPQTETHATGAGGAKKGSGGTVYAGFTKDADVGRVYQGEKGSAARFFYCAKASKADRNSGGAENNHPTVKPTDLMRYLCRLVTPAGGLVLDPFMGSGSTLKAAELEGFNAIGIELSPEYIDIARRRIGADAPLFMEPA